MKHLTYLFCLLSVAISSITSAKPLPEIVVTAELIESSALELPNSVSVFEQNTIEQHQALHLENLLNLAPNVNYSSGASRGRFIQIRGIGERSEFQEPIINSVGLIIDGIDMTGIATAASTLDIKQVEVFRGPQGTLFGANALAGLINMVSNQPSDAFYARISGSVEEYNSSNLSAVISNSLSSNTGYRFAINKHQSDGYINNLFLNKDDTNNIDETIARGTLSWQPNNNLDITTTLFIADVNNGYDAFGLDGNRDTYSDKPGHDTQKTTAASIKANLHLGSDLHLESTLSHTDSELEYGYDEDWSNTSICEQTACDSDLHGFDWWYSSFDNYQRDNKNSSLDLRLISQNNATNSWVLGAYLRDQTIDLDRTYTYLDNDFKSKLETTNNALYGQLNNSLNELWSVTAGLRFEMRDVDYSDNDLATASPDENLWGGKLTIEYRSSQDTFYYGVVSRGYKAGGFNLGNIEATQREFDTETMLNYEIGVKRSLLNDRLHLQAALFYQDRDDIQSKQSIVRSIATGVAGDSCPCSFTDFTDNAASGNNYGLEVEFKWAASDRFNLYGSAGLLETEFDQLLTFEHVLADKDNGVAYNLKGREQAHAPSYQFMLGGQYLINDQWQLSGSIEGKDDFYFSDRHEERSDAYEVLNLELAYRQGNWLVALYGKNITDENIKTRGFGSFGNDPRKFYETEPYYQFAAPRIIGIKASYDFQ